MDIRYRNRSLQRCAASHTEAVRRWGPKVANAYRDRLQLLRAAEQLQDLSASRSLHLHPLKGQQRGQWALNLTERWRLIIRPVPGAVRIEEVTGHYDD